MKKFGTFGGVFIPNILTILGVIMYLRMGWVVGNAGLFNTLIILTIANLITLFTAFSMSSIATNMKMKGGGAYFMISRSLGIETGGAIGIPLYLAQAMGIGLYIVGFSESIINIYPQANALLIGIASLIALTVVALISSGIVVKIQYIIFGIVILSLVSFFTGISPDFNTINTKPNYSDGFEFWSVFAIFFPAVTGILSGVSMSGDLKNPAKSIPKGTILSVIAGFVIYFSIAIWFSAVATPQQLTSDNGIMISIARWSPLIYLGIWGATLSSALANIMAAPRTMQALASDGILFKILKKGKGEGNEPVIATIVTFFIVSAVIYIGKLNVIASVLTMFFLITYGSINIIAFIEKVINRPGYRPTFKAHWLISLIGAVGSIWVMFIINVVACLVGFAVVILIYFLLMRIQLQKNWGDVRRGVWSAIIQHSLFKLDKLKEHPKNWRPNILVYSKDDTSKKKLLNIAVPLTKKNGFITFVNLYNINDTKQDDLINGQNDFKQYLTENNISAFHSDVLSDNVYSSQMISAQAHGIGDFKHNTILLEWADPKRHWMFTKVSDMSKQFKLIRFYRNMNLSLMIMNINIETETQVYKNIDVWWDPSQDNGSFMLLVAHLITLGNISLDSIINIKTIVLKEKKNETKQLLEKLVHNSRIKANIHVLYPEDEEVRKHEILYNNIQHVKKGKEKLLNLFNNLTGKQAENQLENNHNTLKKENENENINLNNNNNDDAKEINEDKEIKEKLSESLDEKDKFLIKKNINNLIVKNSVDANLVLLGFNLPKEGKEQEYIEKIDELLKQLPDTLLVNCPFELDLFG